MKQLMKSQALQKKLIKKIYLNKFVKKSQIRKSILNIRKKNIDKDISINFKKILKILKNKNIKGKIIGGYYPYNNELDCSEILKKFAMFRSISSFFAPNLMDFSRNYAKFVRF